MNASVLAIRQWKLILGHMNKRRCWWALAVSFLAILIVFELAGLNDGKGLRFGTLDTSPHFGRFGDDSF
jgi:hypothetical protein